MLSKDDEHDTYFHIHTVTVSTLSVVFTQSAFVPMYSFTEAPVAANYCKNKLLDSDFLLLLFYYYYLLQITVN